jgi:hypothetical protein
MNEVPQLPNSRKLSQLAKSLTIGVILSGKFHEHKVTKVGGVVRDAPVLDGVLTLLRIAPRSLVPHEVESAMRAAQKEGKMILMTRKEKKAHAAAVGVEKKKQELENIPAGVQNIIEVAGVILQFMKLQFFDDPATRREKRRKGELDLIDPVTTIWAIVDCGTCAQFLPEQHPKHLDLMKLPLQRTLFLSGLIIDNYKAANDLAGIKKDEVQPPDHSVLVVSAHFLTHLIHSPRGRHVLSEEASAVLVVKMMPLCGVHIDLSDHVNKSRKQMSTRLSVLLLRSNQPMHTNATIFDILFAKIMSEEGLIYKEDLQEVLINQGLSAIEQIMDAALAQYHVVAKKAKELEQKIIEVRAIDAGALELSTTHLPMDVLEHQFDRAKK